MKKIKSKKTKFHYSKLKSAFHFFKKKKVAPSGLIIYFGQRGTGKSTHIAKQYYQLYKQFLKGKCPYKRFYTNLYIPNADKRFYTFIDLNKYKLSDYVDPNMSEYKISSYDPKKHSEISQDLITNNGYLCVDELGCLAHNRDYKNFPKETTTLIKMIRHYGIMMVTYSQAYDIDKTIRTGANSLYLMRKVFNTTFALKLRKQIVVASSDDGNRNADSQIMDKVSFCCPLFPSSWVITFIPFYTDLFNSYE